jgi:hypothetical protein
MDARRSAWSCAEESEGGEKKRRAWQSALFKQRQRGRRGGGPGVVAAWQVGTGKRGGPPGAAWDSAAARQRPAAARPRRAWALRHGHVVHPAE